MDNYVIFPTCTDLNRGDQALVWETIEIAKQAGFDGTYYLLGNEGNETNQSKAVGIQPLMPILKHPGRMFKSKLNHEYNSKLLIKWGGVAFFDLVFSMVLLIKPARKLISVFLPREEKVTLNTLKTCKACFVKGGGFIHSYGHITDLYTVYFQLFHILLAQSLGKPVFVMPNSFGPFKGLGVSFLVKKILKNCSFLSVRESISQKELKKIGLKSNLFPDLGFRLRKSKLKNIDEIENILKNYPQHKLVSITVRPYRFPEDQNSLEKYDQYIKGMVKISKWLFDNYFFPIFVEQVISDTHHESDFEAISKIVKNLDKNKFAIISNNNFNCRDLKAIYSCFDYTIGTRFHSVIFSLAEGVPSIAITYGGNKGQGIMMDLNLSKYAIAINEFEAEKVIYMFKQLVNDHESVRNFLSSSNLLLQQKYLRLIYKLKVENI